jgi:hypothetical protein
MTPSVETSITLALVKSGFVAASALATLLFLALVGTKKM